MSIAAAIAGQSARPMSGTDSRAARTWARAFAVYALVGGVVSLIGWAADLPRLASWDGGISIQPNAALAAAAAGAALLLLSFSATRSAAVLGAMVAAIGV